MSKRFPFLGIPGRVVFKFDMGKESLKKIIIVDGGFEPTIKKNTHTLSVDDACFFIGGY